MRGAGWFVTRMPARAEVEALARESTEQLVELVKGRAVANYAFDLRMRTDVDPARVKAALDKAIEVARKLATDGERAQLDDEERAAIELFVLLVSRPALFVRDGRAASPPANWREIVRLGDVVPAIAACVGRAQTASGRKVGTGFLVGPRRALTNNHVVCGLLGQRDPEFWRRSPEEYRRSCARPTSAWPDGAPVLELGGEIDVPADPARPTTVAITRVVGHHAQLDVAVLELADDVPGAGQLALSAFAPEPLVGRRVFAMGYPTQDAAGPHAGRVTPEPIFTRIFGADASSLGTKRMSPGIIIAGGDDLTIHHDASTLPGSSGSCVVDFATARVLAIHFSGSFAEEQNRAVPLWKLVDDPLFARNIAFR